MKVYESHHEPLERMALHRHATPYAALVLAGGFVECGPDGRFDCGEGTLIVHPAWHPHADEFGVGGAVVLNLPIAQADAFTCSRVCDTAGLETLARRSPACAGRAALEETSQSEPLAPAPWLERLVSLLAHDDEGSISQLAARCGVSAEHASRACKRWFGLSPAELRREARLVRPDLLRKPHLGIVEPPGIGGMRIVLDGNHDRHGTKPL